MTARPIVHANNRAWTQSLIDREIAYCRREAIIMRDQAARLLEKAAIMEKEAKTLEAIKRTG